MKRYKHLYEEIISIENIKLALIRASKNKRHRKSVKRILANPELFVNKIHEMLKTESYVPSKYTQMIINEDIKPRKISKLPFYPDRIIQHAILNILGPIFKESLCLCVCASVPCRGISLAHKLSKKYASKYQYCLKLDISKYYESIDQNLLKKKLQRKFLDTKLIALLFRIINSYEDSPGRGIPIGSYLSQFFANFFLNDFDRFLKETLKLKSIVRYMDDVCIYENSKNLLQKQLYKIKNFLQSENLKIKHNYQIFCIAKRGVDFVGYRFFDKFIILRKRIHLRYLKLCAKIKQQKKAFLKDIQVLFSYFGRFFAFNSFWYKRTNFYPLEEFVILSHPKYLWAFAPK